MAWWEFGLWMLPWTGIAIATVYAGYLAYQASLTRAEVAALPPPGPDPALEFERINTELARVATQNRQILENARDSMRKGLKG